MPQTELDADFLFGIHESGGELYMLGAGKPGWILVSEAIGHDPNDRSGKDYSAFSSQGFTVIVRLNHGYYPHGTLPARGDYGNFARRCANFVAASQGCRHWIIGNEMNYAIQRPAVRDFLVQGDADDPSLRALPQRHNALNPILADVEQAETAAFVVAGDPITPEAYARCYRLCRNAIHLSSDHAEDRVLIGAVCPWNTHTVYAGNPQGDWIKYFQDMLLHIGPYQCDGITLHVYTLGADPSLILDDTRSSAFSQYAQHFQIYRDFMGAIPANMRQLPVYITETNQIEPWEDDNTGWVQEAYAEIHRWNQKPDSQKIRSLILHRWPRVDRWHIDGKSGVIEDFIEALRHPYRWHAIPKGHVTQIKEPESALRSDQGVGHDFQTEWVDQRAHSSGQEVEDAPIPQSRRNSQETKMAPTEGTLERPRASSLAMATSNSSAAPEVIDVRADLALGDQPYLNRTVERIQFLVLNHTGAPPILPIGDIVAAHLDAGYPGIAYQFFICQNGEILQTSGLDEVVNDAEWAVSGINIALEGDFNESVPSQIQLDATADLCAWLIGQIPGIDLDKIVGLCELIQTLSPGVTYLEGPTWRRLLQDQVSIRLHRQQSTTIKQARPVATPVRQPASGAPHMRVAARPHIEDVTTQLSRDPLSFYSRRAEDIHTIVINNTGVPAETSLNAIAEGYRERGLPGILYQFYIAENGVIYQTQPILQVVDGERSYIANAINVAFAGEFDTTIPNTTQLEAGGALITWLLSQYTHLSLDDIKGVSELIPHSSPGEQWLRGRRWKEMLVQATVQVALEPSANTLLKGTSTENQQSVQRLERENNVLQQQVSGLRAENERLRREIGALRAEPQRVHIIAAPDIVDIVNALPHHPALRYDERRLNTITHIAIHHTAVPPHVGPERIAELHISEDPSRNKRPWPGIGYHYFVRADGRILRTQPIERITYHAAGHNEYAMGIVFAGSFMNGVVPTPEQLAAGAQLTAWLLQEIHIPLQNVWGHQEFADSRTICPGSEWMSGRQWRNLLYDAIVRAQRGAAEIA